MDKIKAKDTKQSKSVGRPKIEIDLEILKNLASIGCPDYEIASVMNISARTLKRNYAEIVDQYREQGKASLRKVMWDKAVKKRKYNDADLAIKKLFRDERQDSNRKCNRTITTDY